MFFNQRLWIPRLCYSWHIFWTRWFSTSSFIAFCFAGSHLLVNNMCLTHMLSIYATASCWSFCIVYKFLNLWYVFKSLWNLNLFSLKNHLLSLLLGLLLPPYTFTAFLLFSFEVQDKYLWGNAIFQHMYLMNNTFV